MECSPRGGGNRLAECLEYATGVKLVENSVRAALGMPIVGVVQKMYDGYWAEVILHSNEDGIFDALWIDESVKKEIVEQDLWIEPGTKVKAFSAANRAFGTLILRFGSENRMQEVMKDPSQFIKVKLRK